MIVRSAVLLLIFLITACASTPVPEKHYHRMNIEPPKSQTGRLRAPALVVVERPRAPAVYSERGMVYSEDSQHMSLQHYPYDFWVDPPPRLVQQELIRYLQAANPTVAIAAESGREQPDYTVRANLERFERLKTGKGWKVVVAMQLRVERGSTSASVMARDYSQQLDAADNTVEATVQAFSVATGIILREFTADLDKALPATAPLAGH